MQSFPQQQAVPTGPSVSSASTRNSKLDQIIQVIYNGVYEGYELQLTALLLS